MSIVRLQHGWRHKVATCILFLILFALLEVSPILHASSTFGHGGVEGCEAPEPMVASMKKFSAVEAVVYHGDSGIIKYVYAPKRVPLGDLFSIVVEIKASIQNEYTLCFIADGDIAVAWIPRGTLLGDTLAMVDVKPGEGRLMVNVGFKGLSTGIHQVRISLLDQEGRKVEEIPVNVEVTEADSPKLLVTLDFADKGRIFYRKGEYASFLVKIKNEKGEPMDASIDWFITEGKAETGWKPKHWITRLHKGLYEITLVSLDRVGSLRLRVYAKKTGYGESVAELGFIVASMSVSLEYSGGRILWITVPRFIAVGDMFTLELLLKNLRNGFYNVEIYHGAGNFTDLFYSGILLPRQTLYPIRIPVLYSKNVERVDIYVKVRVNWTMESFYAAVSTILPSLNPLPYIEYYMWFQKVFIDRMVSQGFLPKDFYSTPDSYLKAIKFIKTFEKMCSEKPDYVAYSLLELAKMVGVDASITQVKRNVKYFYSTLSPSIRLALYLLHVGQYPSTEKLHITIYTASGGEFKSLSKGYEEAPTQYRVESGFPGGLLQQPVTYSTQPAKWIGTCQITLPQESGGTIEYWLDASFNTSETRYLENLRFMVLYSVAKRIEGTILTGSVAENSIHAGAVFSANVSMRFRLGVDSYVDLLVAALNKPGWLKDTLLGAMRISDALNVECGVKGVMVAVDAEGTYIPFMESAVTEMYKLAIEGSGRISLLVSRSIYGVEMKEGILFGKLYLTPEVFNVTEQHWRRMALYLVIPSKGEIVALDPKPSSIEGTPKSGLRCIWEGLPLNISFYYIIDTTPPRILSVAQEPEIVSFTDSVTVEVEVEDAESGVYKITLYYSVNDGAWNKIEFGLVQAEEWGKVVFANVSKGIFKATIPSQPFGVTVKYYIVVVDRVGLSVGTKIYSYYVGLPLWLMFVLAVFTVLGVAVLLLKVGRRKPKARPRVVEARVEVKEEPFIVKASRLIDEGRYDEAVKYAASELRSRLTETLKLPESASKGEILDRVREVRSDLNVDRIEYVLGFADLCESTGYKPTRNEAEKVVRGADRILSRLKDSMK